MVCKEDVFLWFKDLESYDRLEVMYELLNMCIPFEIRFLGSCIEEIGKHSFQELRGTSIIANDVERLKKDPTLQLGLGNESARHRAVIYMSVLSSRNCICANWFYSTLFKNEQVDKLVHMCSKEDTNDTVSELLLLFTLAAYHPAFTFAQKTSSTENFKKIKELSRGTNVKPIQSLDFMHRVVHQTKNQSSPNEPPIISLKSPPCIVPQLGNEMAIQHPPPGLPPLPHPTIAMPPLLRPAFAPVGTVIGTPEVHPFSTPSSVTLVSKCTSPPQSRPMSPHRTMRNMVPTAAINHHLISPPAIHTHIDNIVASTGQMLLDPIIAPITILPYNSNPEISNIKSHEEVNHIAKEKMREVPWITEHMKQNGLRYPSKYLGEHMPSMHNMEPENSLHHSDSGSSSQNQSPSDTPNITPAVTPHEPGRGGVEPPPPLPRINGGVGFMCDVNTILPPPPQHMPPPPQQQQQLPQFSCSVPSYLNQQQPPRYMFAPFNHTHPFPYSNTSDALFNAGPSFYAHSSPLISQSRLSCYNCGGVGHSGSDCEGQTIEDLTETPNILKYAVREDEPDK